MKWFFGFLADGLNNAERAIIDFVSAFVPYAVPVIPAYLTFYHTQDMMGFPAWVAWTAAFVVEALGLASVTTVVRFYLHNKRYKSEQNKAPFWIAFSVYVAYLTVVIVVNIILEAVAKTRGGWIITAIGLFSLLSFPSGVLISLRTQYREMLEERKEQSAQRKAEKENKGQAKAASKQPKEKHGSDFKDRIPVMLQSEFEKSGRVLTPKEITSALKIDHARNKGFVSTATAKWMEEKGITRNGADASHLTF